MLANQVAAFSRGGSKRRRTADLDKLSKLGATVHFSIVQWLGVLDVLVLFDVSKIWIRLMQSERFCRFFFELLFGRCTERTSRCFGFDATTDWHQRLASG